MVARTAGRKGRPWRQVQARVYAEETHCYLCGKYVDQALVNYRHREARSVHHLIPPDVDRSLANTRTNLRLAHLGCNSTYGRGAYKGAPKRGPSPGWGAPTRAPHGQGTRRAQGVRGWVGATTGVTRSDRDW